MVFLTVECKRWMANTLHAPTMTPNTTAEPHNSHQRATDALLPLLWLWERLLPAMHPAAVEREKECVFHKFGSVRFAARDI